MPSRPREKPVLPMISPAFTASFALADLILDEATPRMALG